MLPRGCTPPTSETPTDETPTGDATNVKRTFRILRIVLLLNNNVGFSFS